MQYKPLLSEVKLTSTYSTQRAFYSQKKLKVKKKEVQMLEIWEIQHYI